MQGRHRHAMYWVPEGQVGQSLCPLEVFVLSESPGIHCGEVAFLVGPLKVVSSLTLGVFTCALVFRKQTEPIAAEEALDVLL